MNVNGEVRMNHKITYDVYVGHLPKNIDEAKLHDVFSEFGEVSDILCRFARGNYGYAIVKYRHKKDADRILTEIDKVSVDGNDMEVRHAIRSNQNENGTGNTYGKQLYPEFAPPMLSMRGMNYNQPPVDTSYMHVPVEYESNEKRVPLIIEVLCTSVENAVVFFGCPIVRYEELHNLAMKMNSICPNLMRLLRKPAENKIYGALYGEDMSWYRCSVIHNCIPSKPGTCIVKYIDYGNVDEVSYTNMVDLPEPIKRTPSFAVKYIFSNLVCNSKSHSDVSYLHHLVNQRMSLCAVPDWGIHQYNVLKCSCNGIDVISELVRNGFAVYKNQKNSSHKSVPNSSKPEKSISNAQEYNKKSKMNGIKNVIKKSNGHVENAVPVNGIESHSPSEVTNSSRAFVKARSMLVTEDGHQLNVDFVPKKIIKRGSKVDVDLPPVSEEVKVKDTVNQLLKIDCVLSNLKLVNNVRALVSLSTDASLINSAVDLLLNESDVKPSEDSANDVKEAYREYNNVLNEIKNCEDQALSELKVKREIQKTDLCSKLAIFIQTFDTSILEKQKAIQKMITDLESNSNAWMNVYLPNMPATVEELLTEYNNAKEHKWSTIQKARHNTNEMHKKFMKFLSEFQKEFSLNMMDGNSDQSYQLNQANGKKGSCAVKFEEAISNLGKALEEEMKTCTMKKGISCVSVIQCILDKIDIPKEKIDTACEIYEKYKELYNDLQKMTDLSKVFEVLSVIKEEINALNSEDVKSEETEKLKNMIHFAKLHIALLKEDELVEILAKASALHYPELVLEHPELNLAEYQNNSYLMKPSWRKEYFPVLDQHSRVEPSYISRFAEHPVVIKEFSFDSDLEKVSFMKKAVVWNEIKSKLLTKVEALFNKDEKTVCAILPHVFPTLLDNPLPVSLDRKEACNVLQQILVGLKDIHSRGMAHGAVHPLAVLYSNQEVFLDFNYDLRYAQEKMLVKGINFQIPNGEDMCKSADMYGFGCLVLWILFPNLAFTSTEEGTPNLAVFQSILADLLSSKDLNFLIALLSSNPNLRPSSRMLLSSGFLKDLRIISDI